jgi:DnaJ-class molecular chaperone
VHTHYDNLKVARNAPPEVIRAAYKSLSQKYHPDMNPGNPDASRIMAIINEAYNVLSDPNKRKAHDEWIRRAEAGEESERIAQFKPPPRVSKVQVEALAKSLNLGPLLRRRWTIYVVVGIFEIIFLALIIYLW